MEAPEVAVRVKKNGVFLQFPISYMVSRFGKLPEFIKLACGGREVVARLYTVYRDEALYRVYSRYVAAVLDSEECVLNT
jgi:uncharacterized protein YpmS